MSCRHLTSEFGHVVVATVCALVLGLGCAGAQAQSELADRLPEVIPAPQRSVGQALEFGLGLGRYDFEGSDETSAFNSQFVRYSRSRAGLDSWRLEVGRQHRFDATSLDFGLGYSRNVGRTTVSAGISSGTSDVLANEYRFDLGVARPIAGFLASLGYTRVQSKGENSTHGWGVGLIRWLDHLILSAGLRVDYGQPGDTRSATTNLGATYYVWRKTYVGAGVSFGEVSYQLVGPGFPLSSAALVDYDAWSYQVSLSRYLNDRSGINLRYDHSRAKDIWSTDGISASYFREW